MNKYYYCIFVVFGLTLLAHQIRCDNESVDSNDDALCQTRTAQVFFPDRFFYSASSLYQLAYTDSAWNRVKMYYDSVYDSVFSGRCAPWFGFWSQYVSPSGPLGLTGPLGMLSILFYFLFYFFYCVLY